MKRQLFSVLLALSSTVVLSACDDPGDRTFSSLMECTDQMLSLDDNTVVPESLGLIPAGTFRYLDSKASHAITLIGAKLVVEDTSAEAGDTVKITEFTKPDHGKLSLSMNYDAAKELTISAKGDLTSKDKKKVTASIDEDGKGTLTSEVISSSITSTLSKLREDLDKMKSTATGPRAELGICRKGDNAYIKMVMQFNDKYQRRLATLGRYAFEAPKD